MILYVYPVLKYLLSFLYWVIHPKQWVNSLYSSVVARYYSDVRHTVTFTADSQGKADAANNVVTVSDDSEDEQLPGGQEAKQQAGSTRDNSPLDEEEEASSEAEEEEEEEEEEEDSDSSTESEEDEAGLSLKYSASVVSQYRRMTVFVLLL